MRQAPQTRYISAESRRQGSFDVILMPKAEGSERPSLTSSVGLSYGQGIGDDLPMLLPAMVTSRMLTVLSLSVILIAAESVASS